MVEPKDKNIKSTNREKYENTNSSIFFMLATSEDQLFNLFLLFFHH